MTMKIYHYHPDTGEFVGASEARKDPLEKDRYLIPANATEVAPPDVGKNQVAAFIDGAWQITEDRRGDVVYNKADTSKWTVEDIGPLPNKYTVEIPASSRDTWDEDSQAWIAPPVTFTPYAFWQRFTKTERKNIRTAARNNEDLEDWIDMLRVAQSVVVTDPNTIAGMQALVDAGLLTESRRDEIMANN